MINNNQKPTSVALKDRALAVAGQCGIARARDFYAAGVPHTYLRRLQDQGLLERIGRGIYQLSDMKPTASHSLAVVSKVVPHGVICLLSALQFHQITTQLPHQVWILIGHKKWAPTNRNVPLRIIRTSSATLTAGIERHSIEGVPVPITNPAKTVADCFKHRNKIGIDVAVEALRECIYERRAAIDEIWRFSENNRVANVIRPYLEAII